MSILTLTMNPTIDKSSSVDQVVAERKLRCGIPRFEPGGGGINVSRAVSNLGGLSKAIYPAGGHTGELLQKLLDEEGVDQIRVPIQGRSRENLVILEESTGRQFRFGMPGPALQEPEWQRCLELVASADPKPDYLIASGSLPPGVPEDFYARVARIGQERNFKVIVDTSREPLRIAAAQGVFLLKPNLRELAELAEEEISEETYPKALARRMVDEGRTEVIVLSLGSAGALLVSREGAEQILSPTVPIRSKVGAGDSMVAGIVLGLDRGMPLLEAVRFGVAAGAAAVMTPSTELCRREDTERLYRHMNDMSSLGA